MSRIHVFCSTLDIVSSDLNSDGSQSNPDLTQQSTNAIQSVYYGTRSLSTQTYTHASTAIAVIQSTISHIYLRFLLSALLPSSCVALYILLLIFAFLVLPFFYFYFEEDSEDATIGRKACSAFKYMIGFVIFFVVLLALGLVLRKGKRDDDTDWRDKLSNDFTHGEAVLSFCIGCLSCFGLCGYVIYAGYGLARMPLKLLSRAKVSPPTPLIGTDAQSRTGLLDAHRRREAKEAKRHIPLSDVRQGAMRSDQHTTTIRNIFVCVRSSYLFFTRTSIGCVLTFDTSLLPPCLCVVVVVVCVFCTFQRTSISLFVVITKIFSIFRVNMTFPPVHGRRKIVNRWMN